MQSEASKLIQSPTPRLSAGSTASGMLITRISTRTVASAPRAMMTSPSGHRCGQIEPERAKHLDRDHRKPDEEHDLPGRARVPPDHGELHA